MTSISADAPKEAEKPRRKRRVLWWVLLLGLIFFVGVAVWSHWYGASFGRVGALWSLSIRSEYGRLAIYFNTTDAGDTPRWVGGTWAAEPAWVPPNRYSWWWRNGGFGYGVGGTRGGNVVRVCVVPYWAICVLLAISLVVVSKYRRRGFPEGCCSRCGYDLRASPERCPECGLERGKA